MADAHVPEGRIIAEGDRWKVAATNRYLSDVDTGLARENARLRRLIETWILAGPQCPCCKGSGRHLFGDCELAEFPAPPRNEGGA